MKRNSLFLALVLLAAAPAFGQTISPTREVFVQKVIPASIAFSPDGRYLAVSGATGNFSTDPGKSGFNLQMTNVEHVLLLLETGSYKVKRRLMKAPEKGLPFAGTGEPVVFSPDGRMLLTCYERSIQVFDVKKGKKSANWGRDLSRAVFSPDARWALAEMDRYTEKFQEIPGWRFGKDAGYELFDLSNGASLGTFAGPGDSKMVIADAQKVFIAYERAADPQSASKERQLFFKNLRSGEEVALGTIIGKLTGIAISRDGQVVAATTDAGFAGAWRLADKSLVAQATAGKRAGCPTLNAEGSLLAFTSDGQVAFLKPGGTVTRQATKHAFGVSDVILGPDATTMTTLGSMVDPMIRLWTISASAPATGP